MESFWKFMELLYIYITDSKQALNMLCTHLGKEKRVCVYCPTMQHTNKTEGLHRTVTEIMEAHLCQEKKKIDRELD